MIIDVSADIEKCARLVAARIVGDGGEVDRNLGYVAARIRSGLFTANTLAVAREAAALCEELATVYGGDTGRHLRTAAEAMRGRKWNAE